ncbi:MAG: sel1 repeat family protein, partial [Gammaproteobacteria bacterium]|nr:sel1 repeat family protein [Gammaproteobacteria bacterium]
TDEAFRWYSSAAEQGVANAQYNLSVQYTNGVGVERDLVMAYVWESVAADQGHENAASNKEISARQLTPEQLARGEEIAARCIASAYQDCD